jgi:diguanylate cyclase (GGDEF)-like protein
VGRPTTLNIRPLRLSLPVPLLAVYAVVLVLLTVEISGVLAGTAVGEALADWLLWCVFALGIVLCATRAVQVPGERLPWALFAAGWAAYVVGGLYFNLVQHGSSASFPQPSDVLWLAFYPCAIGSFALLLRRRGIVRSRVMWIDGAIGALTAVGLGVTLLFSPALGDDLVSAIYAVMDLSMLGFVAVVACAEGWRLDRTWACVVLGLIGITVADSFYLVQAADGAWTTGNLVDLPYVLGTLLLCAAAWQPHRPPPTPEPGATRLFTVPLTFALVSVGLQATDVIWHQSFWSHLAVTVSLVLVVARLGVTFRDYASVLAGSRREALTDAVTGLGNRRRLVADLDAAVASGEDAVVAIFDLDGFKHYNDAYGHAAGDALLARLGRALGAAVGEHGAYRLGGDEFCVLLAGPRREVQPVLDAAVRALTEDGEGFRIDNSHGSVDLPLEVADAAGALKLADQRMYARKNSRPTSALSQTRDLLVDILAEREPDLHDHVLDVGRLAEGTARRLGLSDEEVADVVSAAELHDVGKIAIPDAILHKPGPLDEDEWVFMRRHTIIGERFLAGVPALRSVARYVRSSHEWWDGSGYPDGLAGADIPLGARIITVCDAYAAMTADRPYRRAIAEADALAELRRCAGSQFDPAVVDAFCAVTAELRSAAPPSAHVAASS